MACIKKGNIESLVFSVTLHFKTKATGSNGRNPDTCNTIWLLKIQDLTTIMVKLVVKSLARSKALLESGYVHTRKMLSFLNIHGNLVK